MELMVVGKEFALVWPRSWNRRDRFRGDAGYVVDMDAPLEKDLFCAGQEHKLVKPAQAHKLQIVPDGDLHPTPIDDPYVVEVIEEALGKKYEGPKTVRKALRHNDSDGEADTADIDAVALDEVARARKGRRKSRGTGFANAIVGDDGVVKDLPSAAPDSLPQEEADEPLELAKPDLD